MGQQEQSTFRLRHMIPSRTSRTNKRYDSWQRDGEVKHERPEGMKYIRGPMARKMTRLNMIVSQPRNQDARKTLNA